MVCVKALFLVTVLAMAATVLMTAGSARAEDPWVVYDGYDGPGKGKHIVIVSGDEEYRSEEVAPMMGKILAKHHGFKCTVLFAIDPKTGEINPVNRANIPGLEALKTADVAIFILRFRDLKDEQMKHIVDYVDAGKPIIGMRTSTHAFNIKGNKKYAKYSFRSKTWPGGFGKQILGETWSGHHGHHGKESTRGVIAKDAKDDPIVRGCEDIWGPSDVYVARPPKDSKALIMGQVLAGMKPDDKPVEGKKNNPMMPLAWTRTYKSKSGKVGRVFNTTFGASMDMASEGGRRLIVNASYWCVGLEDKIPKKAKVDYVGEYKPTRFKFGAHKKGLKPSDHAMKKEEKQARSDKPAKSSPAKPKKSA